MSDRTLVSSARVMFALITLAFAAATLFLFHYPPEQTEWGLPGVPGLLTFELMIFLFPLVGFLIAAR